MEKYVIPPFYYSDFKFPSVNKALLKEVKLIFAELAAIALRPPARLPRPAKRSVFYHFSPTRGQFERPAERRKTRRPAEAWIETCLVLVVVMVSEKREI